MHEQDFLQWLEKNTERGVCEDTSLDHLLRNYVRAGVDLGFELYNRGEFIRALWRAGLQVVTARIEGRDVLYVRCLRTQADGTAYSA